MREKLRSSRGMTLTELLVALAIVALIGICLTTGVNSAAKIYRDSTRLFEAETLCGTLLTYLEDEFRFSRNIRTGSSVDEVIFDSQVFGKDVKVGMEDGRILVGKDSADPAGGFVGLGLLGDKAYTSGLRVVEDKCKISYDEDSGQVTITIAVGKNDTDDYVIHTVKVAPVDD